MKAYVLVLQTDDTQNKPVVVIASDKEALRQKLHAALVDGFDPCPLPDTATLEEMSAWFSATSGGLNEEPDLVDSYTIWEYEEEI